jgi:hypothetical protein
LSVRGKEYAEILLGRNNSFGRMNWESSTGCELELSEFLAQPTTKQHMLAASNNRLRMGIENLITLNFQLLSTWLETNNLF